MAARAAMATDVERMVELADQKRRDYEPHAPVFHRPASNASQVHQPWLSALIKDPEVGTFVHEDADGEVDGFLVITTAPAPPVYDPGGPSALVDDFAVSSPDRWASAGTALLTAATQWAQQQGAVQVVVVSGPHDTEKKTILHKAGLFVVSEWFTTAIS